MSQAFDRLVEIMDRLRDPGGCPWDREQTLETLSSYLLEEAYEVVDAVGGGDGEALCEELGDLLLQIVFMARIAREEEWFDVDRVCDTIADKLVRRHPHVFGERHVSGAAEVVSNWEAIKRDEGGDGARRSLLDGVPVSLPALLKAFRMTEKAAAVGFDWERPEEVVATLREEVEELARALEAADDGGPERVRAEMGDVLFSLANLARHLGVEPETALQRTNLSFMRRFAWLEEAAHADGHELAELTLSELDALWERAKAEETGGPR